MKTYRVTVNQFSTCWYNEAGQRHREGGPAIEWANGCEHWYQNGQLHREDGPAIKDITNNKFWYKNNKLHREDGPAIEYTDGTKSWYLNDKKLTEREFNNYNKLELQDWDAVELTKEQKAELIEIGKDFLNDINSAPNLRWDPYYEKHLVLTCRPETFNEQYPLNWIPFLEFKKRLINTVKNKTFEKEQKLVFGARVKTYRGNGIFHYKDNDLKSPYRVIYPNGWEGHELNEITIL